MEFFIGTSGWVHPQVEESRIQNSGAGIQKFILASSLPASDS